MGDINMNVPVVGYETLSRLSVCKPVDRIEYITNSCIDKKVLDIGCYDETALIKRGTDFWLHGCIANVARGVVGLDDSKKIPDEGIETGPSSRIFRGNGLKIDGFFDEDIEIIIAGEFIEHIESPLQFISQLKNVFPGRRMILSTPNGVCFANSVLGVISREAQHPDHIHVFTYKILNTLCLRAGLTDFKIIPYRFFATQMILESDGPKKIAAQLAQSVIRGVERFFPLLSFGYIIDARLI